MMNVDIVNKVEDLIKNAELKKAIELLQEFSKDNHPTLYSKITMFSFRLSSYNNELNMGLTSDVTVKNQIAKGLLDSVNKLRSDDSQKITNPDLSQQKGFNIGNLTFYDKKVLDQYRLLQKKSEDNQLSVTLFIQVFSKLFERGTFRLEPCIRSCDTQFWQRRWISAFDTKRLLEVMLPRIQSELDKNQQVFLFEIKQALFKYCDAMGAYLFETKVNATFLDQYYANNNFPKEKKINFFNEKSNSGEKISELAVKKINQPLRKAVNHFNQLSATMPDSYNYPELPECLDCMCR